MSILKTITENEIIRRYITIQSFDGALTTFGILMANFISGFKDPIMIILPGIGAAIAMCISGMWGAYVAESAEIIKSIKELEKHLLKDLHGTIRHNTHKKMSIIVALVGGFSPFLTSLIILIPIFLARFSFIDIVTAFNCSFIIIALILFSLGVFLGKTAKENLLKNGLKMLLAGFLISMIFYVLHISGLF